MNNRKFAQFSRFALFTQFLGFLELEPCKLNKLSRLCKLYALCLLLFALFCLPLVLEAKVIGVCSNCHTMHNSKGGVAVVTEGPQNCLLNKAGCLGCHSTTTNSSIVRGVPMVLTGAGATDLAGGNFAYITGAKARIPPSEDFKRVGHNVIDLGSAYQDTILTFPPGDQHTTGITNTNFTCAGAKGCHGDRTVGDKLLAIKGAHHADDTVLKFGGIDENGQGGSTGLSYRFLKGVKGGEDSDWQASTGSTDHNEYKGDTTMGTSSLTSPANNTISGLCAECHGYFHGTTTTEAGNASPWLRHPTDIRLPGDITKDYRYYNGGTGVNNPYSMTVPVARADTLNNTNYPTARGTVSPGTNDAIVMCLSCHRTHASPYFKMMRWDYKGWPGSGGTNGCNVCHTSKN